MPRDFTLRQLELIRQALSYGMAEQIFTPEERRDARVLLELVRENIQKAS